MQTIKFNFMWILIYNINLREIIFYCICNFYNEFDFVDFIYNE